MSSHVVRARRPRGVAGPIRLETDAERLAPAVRAPNHEPLVGAPAPKPGTHRFVARRAAALRAERKGLTLADAFVLATAQISGRILVTRNIKVFPASMPGIRIPYTL